MTTLVPAPVPASHDLEALNALVAQFEGFFGPLADLDYDNSPASVLKFAMTVTSPAKHAVIGLQVDGKPVVPQDHDLVCQGLVFVKGELKLAAATRPKG